VDVQIAAAFDHASQRLGERAGPEGEVDRHRIRRCVLAIESVDPGGNHLSLGVPVLDQMIGCALAGQGGAVHVELGQATEEARPGERVVERFGVGVIDVQGGSARRAVGRPILLAAVDHLLLVDHAG
jgi:hypothetical protein